MKLYLTYRRIPELAHLTPRQRKLVYQCGLEALFVEQPAVIWSSSRWFFGALFGGGLVGWLIALSVAPSHQLLLAIACGLAGMLSASVFANHFLHTRLRPYLQRVLEERQEEINQIH